MPWSTEDLKRLVEVEAQLQNVDPKLALAVVSQESEWNPNAEGDNGNSIGLFQLQPGAAKDAGLHPRFRNDVPSNITAGVTYLKQKLIQSGGNVEHALSRYNRGTPDYRGIGDPHYVQNVLKYYPEYQQPSAPTRQQPGMLSRVASVFSPPSAEAATPQAAPRSRLEEIEAELARRDGQATPQTPPQAPQAASAPPPVSQTPPTAPTEPGASQRPQMPDTSWTPGMRFQALPSIQQLPPAERTQRTQEFARLTPALQEEFLRSEEPASDLTVDIEKPSTPQVTQARQPTTQGRSMGIEPVQEGGVERLLAERSPLPSATQQLKTIGGVAIPTLTGMGGAMMGGTLGGPAGAVAGGAAGGVYGTRLATQLGLTEPEEPLVNTVLGPVTPSDVLNVAGPVGAGALAPVVAKVGNALRGVVKPAYQSVVDIGKKYGVRLSYGDVTQGSVAPKVEAVLEAIPGSGAGRMRVGQQKDVTKAGETIRTGLQTEMQQTPWRDLASVQQAAGGAGPRAKEAQVLLREISEAGDDWGRVIQTSGKVNLFQDRVRAEKLYDRVETLAQPLGNMRLPKATQAIDDAITRASDDVLPSPEVKREVIGALNRIKGEISPGAAQPQPSMGVRNPLTGSLQAQPVTQATNIPDTSYMRMRGLRSSLGDLQREAAEPATARYLSGVKTALEEDMTAFTTQAGVPQLTKAAKDADTFFRTRIVPYREGTLAKAIEKNLPDEIYNQFVRRGKDRAEYFYKGLDAKGQAAVRYGMVEEAIEKATSGKPDVFSPARFATSLKKIQDAHGVFFKGTPQWEINGITKLMQHAERAGQYMENPPTGLRGSIGTMLVGGGVGGGLLVNPIAAVTAVGTLLQARQLRSMLMTKTGRNFLLAASDMQPGSAVFQKRLDAFLRTGVPAGAAGAGAAARAPEETAAE